LVESTKKFASLITSTIAARPKATPTIATTARSSAGIARRISPRNRRPKNAMPTARMTAWPTAKNSRLPMARPSTNVPRRVGGSH